MTKFFSENNCLKLADGSYGARPRTRRCTKTSRDNVLSRAVCNSAYNNSLPVFKWIVEMRKWEEEHENVQSVFDVEDPCVQSEELDETENSSSEDDTEEENKSDELNSSDGD